MNKKSIAGLLLFGCLVMSILIYGAVMMTGSENGLGADRSKVTEENNKNTSASIDGSTNQTLPEQTQSYADTEPWLFSNPSDTGAKEDAVSEADGSLGKNSDKYPAGVGNTLGSSDTEDGTSDIAGTEESPSNISTPTDQSEEEESADSALASEIETGAVLEREVCRLIVDSSQVDYKAYLPKVMVSDSTLEAALKIDNPSISIKAEAAILFDAATMEVLYYKNPVEPVFPASTAKLLTCLVVLDWCSLEEEVHISDEIKLIARDSTIAGLYPGQVATIKNLLEGMLLPSGNDAAYAAATYVGRKSLNNEGSRREDAVAEFVRMMNVKASQLGALNSCFKTPDGYDAIGQYTTAYDMGRIGLAAMKNDIILEISKKSSSYNRFVSGDEITWRNTNALVRKDSGRYYSPCIGLKTGTSTMAGKCLIAAGRVNGREVLCAIMNSTQTGRWSDAKTLLDYGLY